MKRVAYPLIMEEKLKNNLSTEFTTKKENALSGVKTRVNRCRWERLATLSALSLSLGACGSISNSINNLADAISSFLKSESGQLRSIDIKHGESEGLRKLEITLSDKVELKDKNKVQLVALGSDGSEEIVTLANSNITQDGNKLALFFTPETGRSYHVRFEKGALSLPNGLLLTEELKTQTINPEKTNIFPTFTQSSKEAKKITIAENTKLISKIYNAVDADANDNLTYTLEGDDADKFEFNSSTGRLSFKTAPDYEAPGSKAGTNPLQSHHQSR